MQYILIFLIRVFSKCNRIGSQLKLPTRQIVEKKSNIKSHAVMNMICHFDIKAHNLLKSVTILLRNLMKRFFLKSRSVTKLAVKHGKVSVVLFHRQNQIAYPSGLEQHNLFVYSSILNMIILSTLSKKQIDHNQSLCILCSAVQSRL